MKPWFHGYDASELGEILKQRKLPAWVEGKSRYLKGDEYQQLKAWYENESRRLLRRALGGGSRSIAV